MWSRVRQHNACTLLCSMSRTMRREGKDPRGATEGQGTRAERGEDDRGRGCHAHCFAQCTHRGREREGPGHERAERCRGSGKVASHIALQSARQGGQGEDGEGETEGKRPCCAGRGAGEGERGRADEGRDRTRVPGRRGREEREGCLAHCSAPCSRWTEGQELEVTARGKELHTEQCMRIVCPSLQERTGGSNNKMFHSRSGHPRRAGALDTTGSHSVLPQWQRAPDGTARGPGACSATCMQRACIVFCTKGRWERGKRAGVG